MTQHTTQHTHTTVYLEGVTPEHPALRGQYETHYVEGHGTYVRVLSRAEGAMGCADLLDGQLAWLHRRTGVEPMVTEGL